MHVVSFLINSLNGNLGTLTFWQTLMKQITNVHVKPGWWLWLIWVYFMTKYAIWRHISEVVCDFNPSFLKHTYFIVVLVPLVSAFVIPCVWMSPWGQIIMKYSEEAACSQDGSAWAWQMTIHLPSPTANGCKLKVKTWHEWINESIIAACVDSYGRQSRLKPREFFPKHPGRRQSRECVVHVQDEKKKTTDTESREL